MHSGPVPEANPPPEDPVLRHRERILGLSDSGRRAGYACFALAIVVFFVGLGLQFPRWTVTTVVVLLLAGSAVFVPSVILGYGAKAADKEDRLAGRADPPG